MVRSKYLWVEEDEEMYRVIRDYVNRFGVREGMEMIIRENAICETGKP